MEIRKEPVPYGMTKVTYIFPSAEVMSDRDMAKQSYAIRTSPTPIPRAIMVRR